MLPWPLWLLLFFLLLNTTLCADNQLVFSVRPSRPSLQFQLRHIHASSDFSSVVFADVPQSKSFVNDGIHTLRTKSVQTYRQRVSSVDGKTKLLDWDDEPIEGPDVMDRETVLELAKMSNNAYVEDGSTDWYNLTQELNNYPFGWEPDDDGFRGHVFVTPDNSSVVLTIKGTTPVWPIGPGGPTTAKDKLNDNLLFSCCCARVGPTWSTVCDCYRGSSKCETNCVEKALTEESLFYTVGINLYNNVSYMYPEANIWLVGHSLGGALASMLGVTFGAPAVAFESPGDLLAARRLHLPLPPSVQHVTHFYHSADPIPQGKCTGIFTSCWASGYAMETSCHLGQVSVFKTVEELGWSVDVRLHGIQVVVSRLLEAGGDWFNNKNWNVSGRSEPRGMPTPVLEDAECMTQECYAWEFI